MGNSLGQSLQKFGILESDHVLNDLTAGTLPVRAEVGFGQEKLRCDQKTLAAALFCDVSQ